MRPHENTTIEASEAALYASELRYRRLFESAKDGILILDAETGRIDDVNPFLIGLLGYSREQFVSRTIWEIGFFRDIIANQDNFSALKENKYIRYENLPLETADGRKIDVEFVSNVYLEGDHKVIQCNIRDITERKRAADALAAEKECLSVTLRSIGDGVITTDMLGKVIIMNKVAEELCGWKQEEALGKTLASVFNIIDERTRNPHESPVVKVLSNGYAIESSNHTLLVSPDGAERMIASGAAPIRDGHGATIGVVLVFRDMTEKQKLLESVMRADKLDSIGMLAAGIAHDFNNLLSGFFGYVDLAKETCPPGSETAEYLDHALTALSRARNLTGQLLTFAKGDAPIRTTGSLATLLGDSTRFALSGSRVVPSFHIAHDLRLCDFDEHQLGQVVGNLVINAVQAMPLGGMIDITAENVEIEPDEIPLLKPGKYIHVSISDSGIGIPQSILPRIFDPFFTTKQGGNGLGLAVAYSIIRKHGGEITVESQPEIGTTVHFHLPASAKEATTQTFTKTVIHKGSGRVLIMDDEKSIRETVGAMLGGMGYAVDYAVNGVEAIDLVHNAAKLKKPFLAIILDLTIPGGMGGREAVEKIRETEKDLQAFVSSGYSNDPVLAHPADYGFTDRIVKPFIKAELANLFSRHFGGKSSAVDTAVLRC